MSPVSIARRAFVAGSSLLLAACATLSPSDSTGPAAAAPTYHVGDRWLYHAQDGFLRPSVWEETHEVVSVAPDAITVRVTQHGAGVDNTRTEVLSAPGRVRVGAVFDDETRRFERDLLRYDFPLVPGKTWNQWVRDYDETAKRNGELNRWVRVGGWTSVTTPAGTFDAVRLNVIMHLDDEEFWRDRTECTYTLWYAPAVGAVVREEKEAQYYEKSGKIDSGPIRSQHALLELVAFTRARP